MKRMLILFFAIGLVLGMTLPAMATHVQTSVGDLAGGIANSRHNLGSSGIHYQTTSTSEICVFCHTPHFSGGGGGAPLWNKNYVGAYTTYVSWVPGGAGANLGYSLACLSCHDGVGTFDNLINQPGPNLNQTSSNQNPADDMGWFFTEDTNTQSDYFDSASRLNIGTDLTNDHPIGIVYPGIGGDPVRSLRPRDWTIAGIDMSNLITSTVSNNWAVNGFIKADATIGELLKAGSFGDAAAGVYDYVECSSCHDPHYKNRTNPEADRTSTHATVVDCVFGTTDEDCGIEDDGLFLRRVGGNASSGVCRTCHGK